MKFDLAHPWQNGPTELIEFAIAHLHGESDFEHRIGFLLLDIGVETLFKTYLTLPDTVTGTKMSFAKREAAATGSFPELIQGIAEATQHRTLGTAITHVQSYHDMRNKLYRQGNGIAVPTEKAYTYAQIAVDLRREVLALMREGRSDQEVRDFLVARYGEFVLYRPMVTAKTWLLWFGPLLFALGGGIVVWRLLRRNRSALPPPAGVDGDDSQEW